MAQFLFYVEGHHKLDELIARLGISDLFEGHPSMRQGLGGPPGPAESKPGMFFGTPNERSTLPIPDTTVWTKAAGYWIGCDPVAKPGPEDLARKQQYSGTPVRLGDGREWIVPTLRIWPDGTCLPQKIGRHPETGELAAQLLERHRDLYEAAVDCFRWLLHADESREITALDAIDRCVRFLSVNYRIDGTTAWVLDLITTETFQAVLKAAVDWDTFKKWVEQQASEKKTALAQTG